MEHKKQIRKHKQSELIRPWVNFTLAKPLNSFVYAALVIAFNTAILLTK